MGKKVPNPYGKKGKQDHQDKIKEIIEEVDSRELIPDTESEIKLENGKKRFADVVGKDEETDDIIEIHQVGRTNKNGTPVKRERDAMQDIEKAKGIKVIFHPLTIILIIIVLTIISCQFL